MHVLLPGMDFGENVAHCVSEYVHEPIKERLLEAEVRSIAHGTAQDAAQNVVPVFVAGLDAVGDGEAQGADMVGDDAESDVSLIR